MGKAWRSPNGVPGLEVHATNTCTLRIETPLPKACLPSGRWVPGRTPSRTNAREGFFTHVFDQFVCNGSEGSAGTAMHKVTVLLQCHMPGYT